MGHCESYQSFPSGFLFKNTVTGPPTRVKPHRTQGWLNPNCTVEELAVGSQQICQAYLEAPQRWAGEGLKTVSTNEKTGRHWRGMPLIYR